MRTLQLAGFALMLSLALPVGAEDTDAPEEDTGPWSGTIGAGYLATSGNTDATTTNFDLEVAYAAGAWTHALTGRAFGASANDVTTAEAYSAGWKTTYDFDDRNYAFGALDYNKDRFAGFTRQQFATAGYGRRILTGETFFLNVEVGGGYGKQTPAGGTTESGAVASLTGDFTWNFSDNASFGQSLSVFSTSDNTFWESVSKVTAGLIGNVAMSVSYTVRQNSDVPVGTKKTDRLTAISLEYAF